MNNSAPIAVSNTKLNELWHQRATLDNDQWLCLYRQVIHILNRCHFRELASLADEKEEYIQSFFLEKVLNKAPSPHQGEIHAGFIQTAFRYFLTDQLRHPSNRDRVYLDTPEDGAFDDAERLDQMHQKASVDECATQTVEQMLEEHGLNTQQVHDSALQWLKAQETWAQLYLAIHFCPDPQDLPPTLKSLADKHHVASYHYRARQLGITNKKSDLPSDFGKTAIGRWAISLGVDITPENITVLHYLFKCLCLATLSLEGVFEL